MFLHKLNAIFAILLFASAIVLGEDDDVHAVQLSAETFPIELAKKDNFVMFYTEWCGASRRLQPTWEQLARSKNGIGEGRVQIAKVNCDVDGAVCDQNDITRYPTLKFFKPGTKTSVEYRGSRSTASFARFINEQTEVPVNSSGSTSPEPVSVS